MANFAKLQSLFEQACELPRDEQAAFVDAACADDAELHAELTALLASDEQVKDHTARKAVGDISALLNEGRPDALVGAQVGRYTLVSLIGAGGMGSVYLAERHDGVVQQRVAIKFLGRDLLGDGFRQRFEIEREILAKLDHQSITRLIDAEQLPDGTPYYVMDYVEGQPITRYAFDQQLDINARLDLFVEVAKAVSHAHQALIVHRDIKPGNILVDTQGAPHLLDFGIAKPLAQLGAQTVSMTVTGQRFFSPQHAAPEQLLGGNITVGCDVYGLGCLLYELLSGEPAIPLTGLTASEAEKQILHQLPQAPSQRVAQGEKNAERANGFGAASVKAWSKSIKGELDSIVLTCLRKLPHERYRSVDDLIADVQAYRAGMPISASGGHGWYRTKKFIARHRWAVTAATLTAIALISSSVITALQSREAKIQRDAAQTALAQAEQQRDRAQHVTQFLIDAFAAANPGGELGKSVTAREILEHGAKKLDTELEGQPELKAQLLATIAEAQRSLGLVSESVKTVEAAVSLADQSWDQKLLLGVYVPYVRILTEAVQLDRAEEIFKVASRFELSDDFMASAMARAEIELLVKQGRQVQALERSEILLSELPERFLHAETAHWYWVKLRRIQMLASTGSIDDADRELSEVTAWFAESPPTEVQLEVKRLRLLSRIHEHQGQLDVALEIARRAVDLSQDVFGEGSLIEFTSRQSSSRALYFVEEYEAAAEESEALVVLARKIFGAEHSAVAGAHYNAALMNSAAGFDGKALGHFKASLSMAESTSGTNEKALFTYRIGYADFLGKRGDCKEALQIAEIAEKDFYGKPEFNVSTMVSFMSTLRNETCSGVM